MIESIRTKVTLKAGKKIWKEGTVLHAPLPPDILVEIRENTGTVEVLSSKKSETAKPNPPPAGSPPLTSITTFVTDNQVEDEPPPLPKEEEPIPSEELREEGKAPKKRKLKVIRRKK